MAKRRRSRALRYSGAGGWPVGLPETIFRATAKASATASLALASVVLALGAGRTGFPKQVSERRKAEGCWTASGRNGRLINQKQISKFGLRIADFILSRIRSLSAVKPSHSYQGLAELQFYQGGQPQWPFCEGASLALASVILALGAGPLGFSKQFSGPSRAVARARSVVPALGAGPSGFPKQFSGRRPTSATASLALASVILALGGGRTGFPKQVSER